MLSKGFFVQLLVVIVLILFQVFIANNFNIGGKYNPFIFLLFLLFYPLQSHRNLFVILSFILGLGLDAFTQTLGVNAFCCTLFAYARKPAAQLILGNKNLETIKYSQINIGLILLFIILISMLYNVLVFSLQSFSFQNLIYVVKNALINGGWTSVFLILIFIIFKDRLISQ